MLLAAALIWGIAFVAQKAASAMTPFALGASRTAIAVPVIALAVILFDKTSKNGRSLFSLRRGKPFVDVTRRELVGGLICGGLLFIATSLQQFGLSDGTDAGKAAFITALYVIIVPIMSLLLRKNSPINAWCAVVIAVIGFYLLCVKSDFSIAPSDLTVFLCTFAFAAQIIAVDILLPTCDGVRISLIQFATVAILSTICTFIFEGAEAFAPIVDCLPEILYLGVLSSGAAYTLQILGQKNTHPAVASVLLSLESVFGALSGAIFLHETMTAREYIGCAVVFLAVVLSQLDVKAMLDRKKSSLSDNNA